MKFRLCLRTVTAAVFSAVLISACGGSHNAAIPALSDRAPASANIGHALSIGSVSGDVVAINAGGPSTGGFAADVDYGTGDWTYTTTAAIDTTAVANAAPQAVYQSQRTGSKITYTIGGLTPGEAYTVKLSFAEIYFTAAGKRVFNVLVNNTQVLSNFDVFAKAGGENKAIAESFPATATSSGTIVVATSSVTNYSILNGLEIQTGAAASAGNVLINAGGGATGSFSADEYQTYPGTWTDSTANAINTAGVSDPAPQAVYQTQRVGYDVSYTIPSLTAGATYTVRLDFAELYFNAAGQRVFNVSINGATVLTNFDMFAAAGGEFRAVSESFTTKANANGAIVLSLAHVTNFPAINGIEITPSGSTPTPTPAPSTFNDYPTYGYDNARDVFNPNSTAFTPSNVGSVHLAWQASLKDYNTQTQPILASGIAGHAGLLFVGGASGNEYAYDALTGTQVWKRYTGQETYKSPACGPNTNYFGIGGTAAYDPHSKSLYVVGNSNPSLNAYSDNGLFHLDAASGSVLGQVDFTPTAAGPTEINFSHTAVTLNNGIAYAGTGSTCDIPSWRGRIAAVNVPAMTVANTFFTVWDPNNARGQGAQPWGGGGIWGWGGVALDPSGNVLAGVGNTDNGNDGKATPPFVAAPYEYGGYGESLIELSPGLSTVLADNHPIEHSLYNKNPSNDLDVQGTPLAFTPAGGCGTMVALQGKSGQLTFYDEARINSGFAAQYELSPSTYADGYLGDPAYSSASGLVYAPVAASVSPTLYAPGLIAVNPGCGSPSVVWHASFGIDSGGNPRAVPAPTAGGVVFAGTVGSGGTGGELWAINAANGSVLNGGVPILKTSGFLRTPPTIDGKWMFVLDLSGNLYALTLDADYPAITATYQAPDARQGSSWDRQRRLGQTSP